MTKISYSGYRSLRRSFTRRSGSISGSRSAFVTFEDLLAERGIVISYSKQSDAAGRQFVVSAASFTLTCAASDRFSHEIRDTPPRFEGMASCDGHQFDPCIARHPASRGALRSSDDELCEPSADREAPPAGDRAGFVLGTISLQCRRRCRESERRAKGRACICRTRD